MGNPCNIECVRLSSQKTRGKELHGVFLREASKIKERKGTNERQQKKNVRPRQSKLGKQSRAHCAGQEVLVPHNEQRERVCEQPE